VCHRPELQPWLTFNVQSHGRGASLFNAKSLITKLLPPGNDSSKELRLIIPYNFSIELSNTLNNIFVLRNLMHIQGRNK
jgi:hypothetical protein